MLLPFSHPHKDDIADDNTLVATHERPAQNTSDGGEFLDDTLRMEDLSPACSPLKNTKMEKNESLNDALRDLKEKGYTVDLSFETETFALYGGDLDIRLNPGAYHVDEIDLVDDTSTPKDEEAAVYAITLAAGIKGIIVDRTDNP